MLSLAVLLMSCVACLACCHMVQVQTCFGRDTCCSHYSQVDPSQKKFTLQEASLKIKVEDGQIQEINVSTYQIGTCAFLLHSVLSL